METTIIKQNRGIARNNLYNDIISYVKPKLAKGETPSQVFRAVKKTKLGSKVQQLLTINGLDTGNAEGNGYNLIDLFKSFGTRFTFPDKPTVKSDSKR